MADLQDAQILASTKEPDGKLISIDSSEIQIDTLVAGTDSWDVVTIEAVTSAAAVVTVGWGGSTGTAAFQWTVSFSAGNSPRIIIDRWPGNNGLQVWAKTSVGTANLFYSKQRYPNSPSAERVRSPKRVKRSSD